MLYVLQTNFHKKYTTNDICVYVYIIIIDFFIFSLILYYRKEFDFSCIS